MCHMLPCRGTCDGDLINMFCSPNTWAPVMQRAARDAGVTICNDACACAIQDFQVLIWFKMLRGMFSFAQNLLGLGCASITLACTVGGAEKTLFCETFVYQVCTPVISWIVHCCNFGALTASTWLQAHWGDVVRILLGLNPPFGRHRLVWKMQDSNQ